MNSPSCDPFPALSALSRAAQTAIQARMPPGETLVSDAAESIQTSAATSSSPDQSAPEMPPPDASHPTSDRPPLDDTNNSAEPARRGRPLAITADKKEEYCQLLRVGCGRGAAAKVLGLTRDAFAKAAQRDPEFAASIQQAEHACERRALLNIDLAAQKNWRAAAWLLENRRGRRKRSRSHTIRAILRSKEFQAALERMTDKNKSTGSLLDFPWRNL